MMKKKKKNHKNKKIKRIFVLLFLLLNFSIFSFSCYRIFLWHSDNEKTKQILEEINNSTVVEEINDGKEIETSEESKDKKEESTQNQAKQEEDESNPYWDYIYTNMIHVDFKNLKKINQQTVGWIRVPGTNINYPFVQAKDNKYYLTHSFDKTVNEAGWVFLDYRNNIKHLGKNTILYAHGRLDKTMFGSLKNVLSDSWFQKKENRVIKISTESEDSTWQIFSVYHIKTTNDYIQTDFINTNHFQTFVNTLLKRSVHNFNVNITDNDKILTLSTCYNETEKMVVHAKLIKTSNR